MKNNGEWKENENENAINDRKTMKIININNEENNI